MNSFARRPYRLHVGAFLAYSLLAILMTLPLAFRLGDSLIATDSSAMNDSYLTVWILGWGAHQLVTDPLNFFHGNIFHPFEHTLAFSEIILPGALLYLPFVAASGNPVLAHNLVVLLSFPLNAFAMYLYASDWLHATDDSQEVARETTLAAFVAGLIFGFCTFKMGEIRHVQLLMALFMPLTFMYLARFARVPDLRNTLLAAVFFSLNALASLYYGVFLAVGVALYVVVDAVQRRLHYSRGHLFNGLSAVAVATVLLLPFALPYFHLEHEFHFSDTRDPRLFSARPASYLATPASQWMYGSLTRTFYVASKGQPLFPGIVTLGLSLIGLVHSFRKEDRAWLFPLLLALLGFVLSFGPVLILNRATTAALSFPLPYYFLSLVVSPLKSLGAPARFAVLTMVALSLLAARGTQVLLRVAPGWGRAIALVGGVLILSEYIAVPLRLGPVATGAEVSPAYVFLASQPRGEAVVEVPMGEPTYGGQNKYAVYVYNSLYHLHPLVNGYSGFIPGEYYALVKDMQGFPSAATVERLRKWGADWIVVHADRYKDSAKVRKQLEQFGVIEHVRDFDAIWLYRIRRSGG